MAAMDHLANKTGHTYDLLAELSDAELVEQREYWKQQKNEALRAQPPRMRDEYMLSRQIGLIDLIEDRRAKGRISGEHAAGIHENDSPSAGADQLDESN